MMKPARTTNVWTGKAVSVEAARHAVVSDPRATPYFGQPVEKVFPNFTARYWYQKVYRAEATILETGERIKLGESSAQALHEKIAELRDALLVKYLTAQVQIYEPQDTWYATLTFHDGTIKSVTAATQDELLLTLASWVAEDVADAQDEASAQDLGIRYPEQAAAEEFLASVPEYRPTSSNKLALYRHVRQTGGSVRNTEDLRKAFDFLYDRKALYEHGQQLDEAVEEKCQQIFEREFPYEASL